MKKRLFLLLVLASIFVMCACKPGIPSGEVSSQPSTEGLLTPIQVIAPFNIYEDDAQATKNVNVTLQNSYKLIRDMDTDDYPYERRYLYMSSGYGYIDIVPEILEADMQGRAMLYTARTNFSGFFKRVSEYLGKETTHSSFVRWRGELEMPADARDTERPEHIWVDILIRADDKIIGFAVLEIVDWVENGKLVEGGYTIEDRYTEYYPLIDGQFQEISEDFVWQRIEQYHKYAE